MEQNGFPCTAKHVQPFSKHVQPFLKHVQPFSKHVQPFLERFIICVMCRIVYCTLYICFILLPIETHFNSFYARWFPMDSRTFCIKDYLPE